MALLESLSSAVCFWLGQEHVTDNQCPIEPVCATPPACLQGLVTTLFRDRGAPPPPGFKLSVRAPQAELSLAHSLVRRTRTRTEMCLHGAASQCAGEGAGTFRMKSTKERDEQAFIRCAPVRACRQAAASSASACTGRARDAHGQTQALGWPSAH